MSSNMRSALVGVRPVCQGLLGVSIGWSLLMSSNAGIQAAHAVTYYQLTDLGSLSSNDNDIRANAINTRGQIVGRLRRPGVQTSYPFIWQNGRMTELNALSYVNGTARSINNKGVIVGTVSENPSYDSDAAFLWRRNGDIFKSFFFGIFDRSVFPSAFESYFRDVNDFNLAVGNVVVDPDGDLSTPPVGIGSGTGPSYPYVYALDKNSKVNLPTLGGLAGAARALNNGGAVVGFLSDGENAVPDPKTAILWQPVDGAAENKQGYRLTKLLPGTVSDAFEINTKGDIVGQYVNGTQTIPFLWRQSRKTDLGSLGGTTGSPANLNNTGQVVGSSTNASGTSLAFLWEDNQMYDLNSLLQNSNLGWELTRATGINDQGWITGYGFYTNTAGQKTTRAFLLQPEKGLVKRKLLRKPRVKRHPLRLNPRQKRQIQEND